SSSSSSSSSSTTTTTNIIVIIILLSPIGNCLEHKWSKVWEGGSYIMQQSTTTINMVVRVWVNVLIFPNPK
ncbi:hypothetical protein ACHAWC_008282, partial [Mediolabrus comicus]